jgi:hypothetical protein
LGARENGNVDSSVAVRVERLDHPVFFSDESFVDDGERRHPSYGAGCAENGLGLLGLATKLVFLHVQRTFDHLAAFLIRAVRRV